MKKPLFLSLAALLGLSACTSVQVDTPPVRYTATKPLETHGTSSFTVSTYRRVNGDREQVKGVSCYFEGDGFYSNFVTPAVVISPNLQGSTPVASVTCLLDGERKTETLNPYNETMAGMGRTMTAAGAAGGLLGVVVGGAVVAAQATGRDETQDVYGYRDVSIDFDG